MTSRIEAVVEVLEDDLGYYISEEIARRILEAADRALASELRSASPGAWNMRGACLVCRTLDAMTGEAKGTVERAVAGTIGTRTASNILTRYGYPVSRDAIGKHRREGHRK